MRSPLLYRDFTYPTISVRYTTFASIVGGSQVIGKRYEMRPGAFVFRPAEVVRTHRVTPRLARITIGGEAISDMRSLAPDDDIRVQIPDRFDDTPLPPIVEFQPFQLIYPENAPPSTIRALTIRALRPAHQELDIEIALHNESFLSRWAEQARPGQQVTVGGPRGSTIWAGSIDQYYLIGDATALPAIGHFTGSLAEDVTASIVAEVADAAEEQAFTHPAGATVHATWLHHAGHPSRDISALEAALSELPEPTESTAIFAAGESARMRLLRRWIVTRWPHVARTQLRIAGYWKREDDDQEFFYEEDENSVEDA